MAIWVNLIFTIFTNRDPYQQPNSPHPQHAGVKEGQPPPPPPPLRTRPSAINSRLKPSDSSFGLHSPDNLPVGFNPQDDKVQVGFILCAQKCMKISRFVEVIRLKLAELLIWAKTAQNRLRQRFEFQNPQLLTGIQPSIRFLISCASKFQKQFYFLHSNFDNLPGEHYRTTSCCYFS